jgi:hypothetical protein
VDDGERSHFPARRRDPPIGEGLAPFQWSPGERIAGLDRAGPAAEKRRGTLAGIVILPSRAGRNRSKRAVTLKQSARALASLTGLSMKDVTSGVEICPGVGTIVEIIVA